MRDRSRRRSSSYLAKSVSSHRSFAYASSASMTGSMRGGASNPNQRGDVQVWLGLFYSIIVALHIDFVLERTIAFLCSLAAHFPSIQDWELVQALLEEQATADGRSASVRQIRQTAETFRLSVGDLIGPTNGNTQGSNESVIHTSAQMLKSRPNLSSSMLGFDQGVYPDPGDCVAAQTDKLFTPASVVVDECADDPDDEWGHFAYYDEDEDKYGDSADQFQFLRQPLEKVDEDSNEDF